MSIVPILPTIKLTLRKTKQPAESHTAINGSAWMVINIWHSKTKLFYSMVFKLEYVQLRGVEKKTF